MNVVFQNDVASNEITEAVRYFELIPSGYQVFQTTSISKFWIIQYAFQTFIAMDAVETMELCRSNSLFLVDTDFDFGFVKVVFCDTCEERGTSKKFTSGWAILKGLTFSCLVWGC